MHRLLLHRLCVHHRNIVLELLLLFFLEPAIDDTKVSGGGGVGEGGVLLDRRRGFGRSSLDGRDEMLSNVNTDLRLRR